MAGNTSPIFSATPHVSGAQFTSADTTTKKTLLTAAANGTRIDGITVCTNDTAAAPLAFYINDGTTDYYLGVVPVPIGSGYTTISRVDALATLGPSLTAALILPTGYILKAACVATMTAAKVTDVICLAGDF